MPIVDAVWQARLRAVLGAPISEVRHQHLEQLVERRVAEAADLDFKRDLYGANDASRQELCKDIAAMRNAGGGVIMLGIRDESGVAVEAPGVALSDAETTRMLQILASGIAPFASCEVEALSGPDPGHGFYVLVAPPSPLQPHAVVNRDWLRYPRRNGTVTRWLTEVEVADSYRSRFREESDQHDRLDRIGNEALSQISRAQPWLLAAAVPNQSGALPMSFAQRRATEQWARDAFTSFDPTDGFFESPALAMAGVGVDRYTLKSHFDQNGLANYSYAECHADGAVVAARQLNSPGGDQTVLGTQLVVHAAKCLRLVGAHALRAGAFGDLVVHVWVAGDGMRLGFVRDGLVERYVAGTALVEGHSRHTFALSALTSVSSDLFVGVRLALMDIFNAFGQAEVPQITADGALRLSYFNDHDLARWAVERGLPTTPERIAD